MINTVSSADNFVIPKHLKSFFFKNDCGEYTLNYSDPYKIPKTTPEDHKMLGELRERDVKSRLYGYGWRVTILDNSYDKIDATITPPYNSCICIPIQIKTAIYNAADDTFTVDITHTERGNKHAQYDPKDVKFIIAWLPLAIFDCFGYKQAVYIFPIEKALKLKRSIKLYPHRLPSKYCSKLKFPEVNDFFEAWYLLDNFASDLHVKTLQH